MNILDPSHPRLPEPSPPLDSPSSLRKPIWTWTPLLLLLLLLLFLPFDSAPGSELRTSLTSHPPLGPTRRRTDSRKGRPDSRYLPVLSGRVLVEGDNDTSSPWDMWRRIHLPPFPLLLSQLLPHLHLHLLTGLVWSGLVSLASESGGLDPEILGVGVSVRDVWVSIPTDRRGLGSVRRGTDVRRERVPVGSVSGWAL